MMRMDSEYVLTESGEESRFGRDLPSSARIRDLNIQSKIARHLQISQEWCALKRVIDVVGSALLLVCLSPLLLVLSALVAISGRPIFFSQQRIGKGGRRFQCFKFRTMVPQAEDVLVQLLESDPVLNEEWMRTRKLKVDPRITRIGAFLRRTSLDELPQLLNVLKGDMSLVGPRPIVRYELDLYARAASWYLSARPGMTGLWQISGRSDVGYRRRIALDTYYVRNQSLLLDTVILFRTIRVVMRGSGAY